MSRRWKSKDKIAQKVRAFRRRISQGRYDVYPYAETPFVETPFTERDTLEIADRIESHETVVEKLSFYQSCVQDPELSHLLTRCRALFSRHTQELKAVMRLIQADCEWNTYSQYEPHSTPYAPGRGGR